MLQQTRVEAVLPYYRLFLERFPTVEDLANAPEAGVLTAWSGLGYYSRARNLHRAAKKIALQGIPASYEEVLAMPGVGPYTAGAIASIALGLPHAAVDGNVLRVISRLTNDAAEIAAPATRRRFAAEAGRLLDPGRPGDFNQAMMELGATVCLPRNPDCGACPVASFCAAHAAGTANSLPVKLKKQQARDIALELAILERESRIWLVKRSAAERRLADFWELPQKRQLPSLTGARLAGRKLSEFRHQIVNDRFRVTVWHARIRDAVLADASAPSAAGQWVEIAQLDRLPLTTMTRKALACLSTGYPRLRGEK